MTNREITAVAAKIFAAYMLIHLIGYILGWVSSLRSETTIHPFIYTLVTIVGIFYVVVIWWFRRFAHNLVKSEEEKVPANLTGPQLESILLRLLGLFFVLKHMPSILVCVFDIGRFDSLEYDMAPTYLTLVSSLIIVSVAFSLIAKPAKWVKAFAKLKGM